MKTNLFSSNRIGLLFQRYFAERFQTELIYWSIMVIVFMFIRNNTPVMAGLILIAGVFYAARFFREIHYSGNGIAYFMIPASQLEKVTVGVVMTSFYYFAMMIIAYVIGNLLGTFLNNIIASMNISIIGINVFHHSFLQWKLFGISIEPWFTEKEHTNFLLYLFELFLVGQSIYMLGSIYFKRNQFFATFLTVIVTQLFLFILFLIELKLFLGVYSINFEINATDLGRMLSHIFKIGVWLLPPFLWVVSYFRLTEKQI